MKTDSQARNPRLWPEPGDRLEGLDNQRRPQRRTVTRVSSVTSSVVFRVENRKEASICTLTVWRKWAAQAAVLPS